MDEDHQGGIIFDSKLLKLLHAHHVLNVQCQLEICSTHPIEDTFHVIRVPAVIIEQRNEGDYEDRLQRCTVEL